ncbi:hypothetical protein ACF0H5_017523 [Mactra antiquata]
MESVVKAWKSKFSEDIPDEFVSRLECELSKFSHDPGADISLALTNVKTQTRHKIDELSKRLRQEEYLIEVVSSVIADNKQRAIANGSVSPVYAKVNKSFKLKSNESSQSQNDRVMSDQQTVKPTSHLSSSSSNHVDISPYEEIDFERGELESPNPCQENKPTFNESKNRDSNKKQGSVNVDDDEGDYATLAVKPVVSPKPSIRRPLRHNTYEEIDLPFVASASKSDPIGSDNNISSVDSQTSKSSETGDSTINSLGEVGYASCKVVEENKSSPSIKHRRVPPPVPQKTHHKVGDHYDVLQKTETNNLKHSEKEPQFSSRSKNKPSFETKDMVVHRVKSNPLSNAGSQQAEGEYCSIAAAKQPDVHVTVLRIQSGGKHPKATPRNSYIYNLKGSDREMSRSSESLNMNRKEMGQIPPNLSRSFDDINSDYAEIDNFPSSPNNNIKSDLEKTNKPTDSDGEVTKNELRNLSKSAGSEDDLGTTHLVNLGDNEMEILEAKENFESASRNAKSKRNRVPDYEKWNFQTLLTGAGVSVTDRESLGDTGSEDETPYDNVEDMRKHESAEDTNKTASPPEDKYICDNKNAHVGRKMSYPEFNRRPGCHSTSTFGSRMSTASCMTVDGNTEFQRSDSIEECPRINEDVDTISVCSNEDMLEKNELEETLKADEKHSYRNEQLRMRHLVVKGILESEKMYLHIIENLVKAKFYLQSSEMGQHSDHPGVIALEDVTTMFYKMDDFYHIHKEFVEQLTEKLKNWSDDQTIAEAVKQLVVYFKVYEEYVNNYPIAVETIRKYMRNEETRHILEEQLEVHYKDSAASLEDVLLRPVQRIQTSHLVLHDLMKHTPEDHPDHRDLAKALKLSEENLRTYSVHPGNLNCGKNQDSRQLVKSGFLVEVSRDKKATRQLRYVFLFSDVLVCTKHKGSSKYKDVSFKYLWYFAMPVLSMHMRGDQKYILKESLEDLKFRIGNLKVELREEMLKADIIQKEKGFSMGYKRAMRNIEKLKKKIQEQEATLVEALPRLPLHLEADGMRQRTFLFSTDYEREEWREAIESQRMKCQGLVPPQLSNHDIEVMISGTKLHMQVNGIGTALLKKDEDMLTGSLNVTIHKMQGLDKQCDVYCCLEMDSYGHFYKKAQTRISQCRADALWNEDFELDLDGSQTLRILCYKKQPGQEDDVIIGKCALELSLQWLNTKFNEKTITMNDISITISIRHTPASKTLKRTQSKLRTGIFGVRIQNVTRRENKTVPSIVTTCVQQIENRGMTEVGIYRVSGVTSEIQNLKKMFDKNPIAANGQIEGGDIHAITGVLKLYFRELPEPLFTDQHYQSFIQTVLLQNEETKEKCMLELLHSLPESNYYTIVFMMEHLVRIAQHSADNKMSHSNLSTIFGPTLMHPAVKDTNVDPMVQMAMAAKDASVQSEVIHFFLKLAASGKNIRKSATPVVESTPL